MSPDLGHLLDQAVPEPPRHLDADTVLTAARRRRRVRSSLVAATAAVLTAVAIGTPLLVTRAQEGSRPDVGSVPLRLSALDRRVPLGPVAAGALDTYRLAHPGEGTLVATVDEHQIYLVETADDQLCVVQVRESYGSAGTSCSPRSDLLTTGVVLPTGTTFDGEGPWRIIIAVPDGYTEAEADGTTATVSNNVAVLEGDFADGDLTVSGPDVPTVGFPLADIVGPFGPPR